jgi:hypothetical protein
LTKFYEAPPLVCKECYDILDLRWTPTGIVTAKHYPESKMCSLKNKVFKVTLREVILEELISATSP